MKDQLGAIIKEYYLLSSLVRFAHSFRKKISSNRTHRLSNQSIELDKIRMNFYHIAESLCKAFDYCLLNKKFSSFQWECSNGKNFDSSNFANCTKLYLIIK